MAGFYQDLPIVLEDEGGVAEYFSEALKGDLQFLFGTLLLVLSIVFAPVLIPLLLVGAFFVIFIMISHLAKSIWEMSTGDDMDAMIFIYVVLPFFLLPCLVIIVLPSQLFYWGALPFTYWPNVVYMAFLLPECTTNSLGYFLNPLLGPIYCVFKS